MTAASAAVITQTHFLIFSYNIIEINSIIGFN